MADPRIKGRRVSYGQVSTLFCASAFPFRQREVIFGIGDFSWSTIVITSWLIGFSLESAKLSIDFKLQWIFLKHPCTPASSSIGSYCSETSSCNSSHWHPKDKCKHGLRAVVKYAWTLLNPGRRFAGCPKVMASWLPAYVVPVVNGYC